MDLWLWDMRFCTFRFDVILLAFISQIISRKFTLVDFWDTCPHHGRFQSNGMRRSAIAPRILIGPSDAFRLLFTHPLFRHLCVEIILFLADETSGFTADTQHFAQTSSVLLRVTVTFRCVDTPSVGSPVSPVIVIEDDSDG